MSGCASCGEQLVFRSDESDEEENGDVPDDLHLPCGCHFHWQCLLDEAAEVAVSLKCPSCESYLPSNEPGPSSTNTILPIAQGVSILTRYHSEGGLEENYDILPIITQEAYESAHPETREARALLTMCAEGDVVGMLELLREHPESAEGDSLSLPELIRYQDPLSHMKSGLHIAIEKDKQEVFYLLLFLASSLHTGLFPASILLSARQVGLSRLDQGGFVDIRELKDANGDKAEAYASRQGGEWSTMVEGGMFT